MITALDSILVKKKKKNGFQGSSIYLGPRAESGLQGFLPPRQSTSRVGVAACQTTVEALASWAAPV